jgi:hypothetical protein
MYSDNGRETDDGGRGNKTEISIRHDRNYPNQPEISISTNDQEITLDRAGNTRTNRTIDRYSPINDTIDVTIPRPRSPLALREDGSRGSSLPRPRDTLSRGLGGDGLDSDDTLHVLSSSRLSKTHRFVHFTVAPERIHGRDVYSEVNAEIENYTKAHLGGLLLYTLKQHDEPCVFTAMFITEGRANSGAWKERFLSRMGRRCSEPPEFIELRPTSQQGEKVLVPRR